MKTNPFRFDRLAEEAEFFDREEEVGRIVAAIGGGENLLVRGPRRMGKTSCLLRAARTAAAEHDALCFFVDLSRYSSLAAVAEAMLRNAVPKISTLGERATTWLASAVKGLVLKPKAKASVDATAAGGPDLELEFGVELKSRDPEAQGAAFIEVLDALDALAGRRKRRIAVILDEFTFIEEIGPAQVAWNLRAAMQRHHHVTYIFAGSAQHMIDALHGRSGPFLGMFGVLNIGPIEPPRFAQWIDARLRQHGVTADGVGEACVGFAGPRTRDILQLARRSFDLAAGGRHRAPAGLVDQAIAELIDDLSDDFWSVWTSIPRIQKSILQAVADGSGEALFSAEVIARYGLGNTAVVTQNCRRLARIVPGVTDHRAPQLQRVDHADRVEFVFDNPYFARWVRQINRQEPFRPDR
jgi:hypothetical protein